MRRWNCVDVVTDYRDRGLWFDDLEMATLTQVNPQGTSISFANSTRK
jgi:hypothetical protein